MENAINAESQAFKKVCLETILPVGHDIANKPKHINTYE
jgi:hypothetical protein